MKIKENLKHHYRHGAFLNREIERIDKELEEYGVVYDEVKSKWVELINVDMTDSHRQLVHEADAKFKIARDQKTSLAKRKAILEAQVVRISTLVAQNLTREICDAIQDKLPRELRDSVYEYLVQPNLGIGSQKFILIEGGRASRYPIVSSLSHCHDAIWSDAPCFWDPKCTGNTFFLELAEQKLRTTTFIFENRLDLFSRLMMCKNRLGLEFAHLIRHVHITIGISCAPANKNAPYDRNMNKGGVREWLRKLAVLRKGSHIDVLLRVRIAEDQPTQRQTENRWKSLQKLIHAIWPVLSSLNSSGYILKVLFRPELVFMPSATAFSIDTWTQKVEDRHYVSQTVGALADTITAVPVFGYHKSG